MVNDNTTIKTTNAFIVATSGEPSGSLTPSFGGDLRILSCADTVHCHIPIWIPTKTSRWRVALSILARADKTVKLIRLWFSPETSLNY